MKIETLILGQLSTNCYLVYDEESGKAIIIDPADDGNFISEKILHLGLNPLMIICTHGHFDHIQAVTELKLAFNIPFSMSKKDLFLIERNESTVKHFTGLKADPKPEVDNSLDDGQIISFGKEKLKIIKTPGHTPGSICLYSKGYLFSGDTLFEEGAGRADFSYSEPLNLEKSLEKLFKLPPQTKVFPGHGDQTTLEETLFEESSA